MATFLTKVQAILDKPLVRKITGQLLQDAVPKLKARVGDDPVIAFAGLATFLAWLAGKLPAKLAKPVQAVVAALGLLGAKAAVTPIVAPKMIVTVPLDIPPAAKPVTAAAGAKESTIVVAAPVATLIVPLVPAAPRDRLQDAITGAINQIRRTP